MTKRWLSIAVALSAIGCDVPNTDDTITEGRDDDSSYSEPTPDAGPGECGDGDASVAGPDLVLEVDPAGDPVHFTSRTFAPNDCLIYEGCVHGDGSRKLLELEFSVRNVGDQPLELGVPWENPLFYESLCQEGYVLDRFVSARLFDGQNALVEEAQVSTSCVAKEDGSYTCAMQGLAAGEASAQPRSKCDFLDVTAVTPGSYTLELTVNPDGELSESNLANNTLRLTVEVPDCDGTVCGDVCCPEGIACHNDVCMVPDLRVNADTAAASLTEQYRGFSVDSCEIEEQCVGGPGRRRLLMFEGRVENWGPGDLAPGAEENNPLFEFSSCHEHYHFKDITSYRLLTPDGEVAALGHKQSFCLISMDPVGGEIPASWGTHPEPGVGGCNYLQAGWADIYGVGTDCQWVDITDVAPGDYILELAVNPIGRITELAQDNNVVQIPYHVEAPEVCVPSSEECENGEDDDCDGFTDWEDTADCEQPCWPEGREYCGDEYDNDCDGQVDEGCALTEGGHSCGEAIDLGTGESNAFTVETGEGQSDTLADTCGGHGGAVYFSFTLASEQIVHLTTTRVSTDDGGGESDGGMGDGDGDGDVSPGDGDDGHDHGDGDHDHDDGDDAPELEEPEASNGDTVLALFAGDCSTGTKVACANSSCNNTWFEQYLGKLPAGRYTVVVRAKQANTNARVRLEYARMDGTGLTVVNRPGLFTGNTLGGSDHASACGYIDGGNDKSYLVAACPETQVVATTCGTSSFDSIITSQQVNVGSSECSEDYNTCSDTRGATITTYNYTLTKIDVDSASSEEAGEYQLFLSF